MKVYIVKRGITLVDISRRFWLTVEKILSLNPTITDSSSLHIGEKIILPENARPFPIIYTIKPGDTLHYIAKGFDISLEMLLRANPGIASPNVIMPTGMKIIIPSPEPYPGITLYIVQPGDSIYRISKKLGMDFHTLMQLNAYLFNPNMLYIGQLLFVPLPSLAAPQPIPFSYVDTTDDMALSQIDRISKNYLEGYTITDMVPLSNGWVILGDKTTNRIYVLNIITKETKKSYQLPSTPNSIDFDFKNGIILANQALTNKIAKIDINSDELTYITTTGKNTIVTAGEDNMAFAYSPKWPTGTISIINTLTNQEIGITKISHSNIGFMAYDEINKNLFLGVMGHSPSNLYRYSFDTADNTLEFKQMTRDLGSNGQDLTVSNDGMHVAFPVGSGNGAGYTIFDIDSMDINNYFGLWQVDPYPNSAFFSSDSKHIVASNSYDVKVFTVDTHNLLRKIIINNRTGRIRRVYFSRGDKIIYVGTTSSYRDMDRLYFYKSGL